MRGRERIEASVSRRGVIRPVHQKNLNDTVTIRILSPLFTDWVARLQKPAKFLCRC
uniref:Uncharacterized protein n=1 Tax=Rhizobium rhizogenes TaxID=359 RepID=A0A4P8DJR4_RHIRH|nr:hypothetical protein pOC-C5.8_555 [Rhizobium rhizogenes]